MSLLDTIKNLFFGEKSEKPVENIKTEEVSAEVIEPSPIVKQPPQPVTAQVKEQKDTVVSEVPEDSTLRRHYLANLEAQQQAEKTVKAEIPAQKPQEPTSPVAVTKPKTVETISSLQIPEDSTLKRHFISALKVEIEASMPARPTDSALRRHYDATVGAKLATLLD